MYKFSSAEDYLCELPDEQRPGHMHILLELFLSGDNIFQEGDDIFVLATNRHHARILLNSL